MYLDDGGDELFQEVVAQQRRPVMVDEVDQKALDVGAILILPKQHSRVIHVTSRAEDKYHLSLALYLN